MNVLPASAPIRGAQGWTACVDVGGTFVDLALFHGIEPIAFNKVLNRPEAPTDAVLSGLNGLLEMARVDPSQIEDVVYSTTLAVNAVVERKGAVTALVTTKGFRDVIEIRTEQPYDLYNPFGNFPEPLVPRDLRIALNERTTSDGSVHQSPEPVELKAIARKFRRHAVESVAICLIHSYANPANEYVLSRWLHDEFPQLPVALSSEVLPQLGEYGRFSTTCVNAYILPLMKQHLSELHLQLRSMGFAGRLLVISSAGGMIASKVAASFPVKLLESGPAAGSVGISSVLQSAPTLESPTVVTFDMGGTTAKSSVIVDGTPRLTTEYEVGRVERFKRGSGLLVSVPSLDIVEIGAGGGSIAYVDAGGLLQVGPESAGSDPGPACYGGGGRKPTVTDADLVLGFLNPSYFLGGNMRLHPELAKTALEQQIAARLQCSVEDAALGIYRVVNANMARALGVHAAETGLTLQRATMVAIGGAGPVHAWAVARELGIPTILVPFRAGIFSAMGCRLVPAAFEEVLTYKVLVSEVDLARLTEIFDQMERKCVEHLEGAAHRNSIRFQRAVDLQYAGQRSALTTSLPDSESLSRATLDRCVAAFEATYRLTFGRTIPGVPVEALTWRVRAEEERAGKWPGIPLLTHREDSQQPTSRWVLFPDVGRVEVGVYRLPSLRPHQQLHGPAVIEDVETTTVIPPGATARIVDRVGLLLGMDQK
ncbi:MAG: hydantoinase/oxoprolinase family protein [Candidatus Dormibacteraceae bacterium]